MPRLIFQQRELELGSGRHTIGSAPESELQIADERVQPTHATIVVSALESVLYAHEGAPVWVNGERLSGGRTLEHRDRISLGSNVAIGADVIVFVGESLEASAAVTVEMERCLRCGSFFQNSASVRGCPHCKTDSAKITPPQAPSKSRDSISTLALIAEKALALGRDAEAERLLRPALLKMLKAARAGEQVTDWSKGLELALALARGKSGRDWLLWVFDLHSALKLVMSEAHIEQVDGIARKITLTDATALREYIRTLETLELSPGERFRAKRVEALIRAVST